MRRPQVVLIVVFIFVVGLGIGIALQIFMGTDSTPVQIELSAQAIAGTVTAEEALIAQMTANPAAVVQMTPYYGDILYNQALRNNSTGNTGNCVLAPDVWRLNFTDDFIIAGLRANFGEVTSESYISVVWHSAVCDEYLPVSSTTIITATEPTALDCPLRAIIDVYESQLEGIAELPAQKTNIEVQITLDSTTINTNLALVEAAILNNLSCDSLTDALRIPS